MRLSITIKEAEGGYMPELVLETPKSFHILQAAKVPCTTWKEAWMVAKLFRQNWRAGIQ